MSGVASKLGAWSPWKGVSVFGLALVVALSGCAVFAPDDPKPEVSATPTHSAAVWSAVAGVQITPTPVPPEPITIVACSDVTSSVPRNLFVKVRDELLSVLEKFVEKAQPGLVLFIRLINSQAYTPEAGLGRFGVPAVSPAPVQPTRLLRPAEPDIKQCDKDPFTRVKCEKDVRGKYEKALADWHAGEQDKQTEYDQALAGYQAQLTAVQTAVKELAAKLGGLKPEVDEKGTDVVGCPLKAGELFASAPGKRFLLIASDLEDYGPQSEGTLALNGAKVMVIQFSKSAARAESLRREWTAKLMAAGAVDVQFRDPSIGFRDLLD